MTNNGLPPARATCSSRSGPGGWPATSPARSARSRASSLSDRRRAGRRHRQPLQILSPSAPSRSAALQLRGPIPPDEAPEDPAAILTHRPPKQSPSTHSWVVNVRDPPATSGCGCHAAPGHIHARAAHEDLRDFGLILRTAANRAITTPHCCETARNDGARRQSAQPATSTRLRTSSRARGTEGEVHGRREPKTVRACDDLRAARLGLSTPECAGLA